MEEKKRATVKDVALEAGVSVATVSAYVNGIKIRPENYAKVEEAVKKLNYIPNSMAKSLKVSATRVIGLVAYPCAGMERLMHSLEEKLREADYRLVTVFCTEDPKENRDTVQFLLARSVDGMVLWNCVLPESFRLPVSLPTVLIDGKKTGTVSVSSDEKQAALSATEFLMEGENRSVGYISSTIPGIFSAQWRDGYDQAMGSHRLPVKFFTSDDIGEAEAYLVEPGLTQEELLRLQAAADLCILGADGDFAQIPLTVHRVCRPLEEMGKKAGDILLRRIEQPENVAPDCVLHDVFCEKQVVVRADNQNASKSPVRKIDYFLL